MQRHHCLCFTNHGAVLQRLLVNLSRSETLRSALCLTLLPLLLQPKKTQVLRLHGICEVFQPDFPPAMENTASFSFSYTVPSGCASGQPKQHLAFHKSRPFHNSALKFLVDASMDDMKSHLKSLGFIIQNDFVFCIIN